MLGTVLAADKAHMYAAHVGHTYTFVQPDAG